MKKMRIRIDLKIFLIMFIFILTNQIQIYMLIMLFALIHELGHLLSGIILKLKPEKIEIIPVGVSIAFKLKPEYFNHKIGKTNILEIKKILISIAGPLTNIIIIWISLKLPINIVQKISIIYANILIVIFNLLPIYPLDGGRILNGILHIQFGKRKAEKYINSISFVCLVLLTLVGSILVYSLKNISIFLIIVCLWVMYIKQDLIYRRRNKIYYLVEKTIENN